MSRAFITPKQADRRIRLVRDSIAFFHRHRSGPAWSQPHQLKQRQARLHFERVELTRVHALILDEINR